MEVSIPEAIARAIGAKTLRSFDTDLNSLAWQKWVEVDLRRYSVEKVRNLRALVEPHTGKRGGKILLKDIDAWIALLEKGKSPRARTVRHFASLVTEVLRRVPGHRVFEKEGDVWSCSYVNRVEYHPAQKERDRYYPAHTDVQLLWIEFGGRFGHTLVFHEEECMGIPPEEALARMGYYLETPELRKAYLKEVERFHAVAPQVGRQFLASGTATDDVDGNAKSNDRWWSSRTNTIHLEKEGEPSRVVVDVFYEDEKEEERRAWVDFYFWRGQAEARGAGADPDEEPVELEDEDEEDEEAEPRANRREMPVEDLGEEEPRIEIPLHPNVAVFDLKRHRRLRVHVGNLTEYVYDRDLKEKLVLPPDVRRLVEMLIEHRTAFRDIVAGKSGGVIVLCAGPPGTGKTLTAEVYAEAMERPLYSVQASQLGTDPDVLEDELMKVLARGQRWNAITLLDEADVYVRHRGGDLAQNAIVGVFLRVLEYHASVLFLTTNRSDLVDDAIASRCMARIDYAIPGPEDQARIWRILADTSGAALPYHTIQQVVERHPHLSGRDVKNLLKLAMLVSGVRKEPITPETVDFVKRFKPTGEEATDAPKA